MRISDWSSDVCSSDLRITSPWKWRHLKSVIVPSVQSPPSMLKLHDFCNRAYGIVFCNMGISLVPHLDDFVMGAAPRLGQRVASAAAAAPPGVHRAIGGAAGGRYHLQVERKRVVQGQMVSYR